MSKNNTKKSVYKPMGFVLETGEQAQALVESLEYCFKNEKDFSKKALDNMEKTYDNLMNIRQV